MKSRPTPTPFDFMQRTDGSCYLKPHGRCKFLDAVVSGHTPFADLTRVLVTMWAMWLARRRAIHRDQFQSPMSTHCFISMFLDELDLVASHHSNLPRDLHATPRDLHVIFGELHARSRNCMQGPGTCMSHDLLREQRRGYNKYTTKRRWMFMVASPEMALGVRRRWSVEARMTSI